MKTSNLSDDNRNYSIKLELSHDKYPRLLDVTSFLYDFELLYDLCVILAEPEYEDFKFTRFFWYRNGRTKKPHKLLASKIFKQSPLTVEVIVASVGGVWVLLQIMEALILLPPKIEKINLENEKLILEIQEKKLNLKEFSEIWDAVGQMGCEDTLAKLVDRLGKNPINVESIEVGEISDDQFED